MDASGARVEEAIRIVYDRFAKRGVNRITKKQILKVLYLAREDLPDGSPLKQGLAYYWYLEGPMSETIYAAHDRIATSGAIVRTHPEYETFSFARDKIHRRLAEHDDDISLISSSITRHTDDYSDIHSLVAGIYEKFAPSAFYTEYGIKFRNKFENFCTHIPDEGKSKSTIRKEDIIETLEDAGLELPRGSEFHEFRMAFGRYAILLHSLLAARRPDKDARGDLELARKLCGALWGAFAYNTRIYHHDPYYDGRVEGWKKNYADAMTDLHAGMDRLEEAVNKLNIPGEPFGKEFQKIVDEIDSTPLPKSETVPASEYLKTLQEYA